MDPLPDKMEQNARVATKVAGSTIGIRRAINFAAGSSSLTVAGADSPTGEAVTVTLDVSGSSLATALAGNGLDPSGSTLVVDPSEFSADMAGNGLDASGATLVVDPTEFTGAGITITGGLITVQRVVEISVTDPNGAALTVGDGKAYFMVTTELGGLNLTACAAGVTTVSSSGTPTVQIANVTQAADMLTTKITIDANESTSYTAATAAVIDTGNDDVATGDILRVDVDVAGTGTKGLMVALTFS